MNKTQADKEIGHKRRGSQMSMLSNDNDEKDGEDQDREATQ